MRAREAIRWALMAAYGVLWIGGIVSRSAPAATPAPPWAAPLFLLLAATIVTLSAAEKWPLAVFAAGGFLVELLGVHTGIPFGWYSYSGALGPSLGGVPLAISCAWLTLLVWTRDLVSRTTLSPWAVVALGGAIMTAVDLLIDPVATRVLGYWHWRHEGVFFGVPLSNFLGWFIVSAILLSIAGRPAKASQPALAIGTTIVCFFGLIAALA